MTERQAEYQRYRKTRHWKQLRASVFERDGHKCTRCGSEKRLQAHHKFYRRRFEDSVLDDLITLCRKHHAKQHNVSIEPPKPRPILFDRYGYYRIKKRKSVWHGRGGWYR